MRLLGVGLSGFEPPGPVQQRILFEDEGREEQGQLDAVADRIQAKFGPAALSRGNGLLHGARYRPEPKAEGWDDRTS